MTRRKSEVRVGPVNHFISGIIKIVILEASIGLLVLDFVAPERFARARQLAFATLAGLMVFAWANYGALREGSSWPYTMVIVPIVLLVAWLLKTGFSTAEPTGRQKSFRDGSTELAKNMRLTKLSRPYRYTAVALSLVLVSGWLWWGLRTESLPLTHPWEQYHFYLGAKYQKEIGYFDLYKATILADREGAHALGEVTRTRALETFNELSVEEAMKDSARVRAQFSDEQWAAFKADWATMARLWPINWQQVVTDHGNSNSPAWAIIAHPISLMLPLSTKNQALIGWLDMLLMLIMWLFVYDTFGGKVASMGLLLWATPPLVFDYLSGSFLRWDWIFALGMAACFMKRGRWATAGAFFSFAATTKLFPILFGVALLIRAVGEYAKTRVIRREHVRFGVAAFVTGLTLVAVAAVMFGADSWAQYAQRIQVAQVEKYYSIQYSLKTVFLQFAAPGQSGLFAGIFPSGIKQALPEVEIADYSFSFLLTRLAFTALIAMLIRRTKSDVEAFFFGPLLVFTWLTVNMYYWNMLGFLAMALVLRSNARALAMVIGLHLIFMVYFLYQHLNRGATEAYAVAFLLCAWVIGFAFVEYKESPNALSTH